MSESYSWDRYLSFLAGLCIFMFYATLLFMELAFVGHTDPDNSTAGFRAAIPATVLAPLVSGILIGHWFHPGRYGPDLLSWLGWLHLPSMGGFLIMAVASGVLLILGLVFYFVEQIDFYFPAWSMLITGILMGTVLWPVYKAEDLREAYPAHRQAPTATLKKRAFWFQTLFVVFWLAMMVFLVIAGVADFIEWAFVTVALFWMAFIIVTDIFLAGGREGDTWSEQIREWSRLLTTAPPWLFGVIAGRWFHPLPQLRTIDNDILAFALIAVATVVVIGAGVALKLTVGDMRWLPPWLVALLGVFAGALLVPAQFPAL